MGIIKKLIYVVSYFFHFFISYQVLFFLKMLFRVFRSYWIRSEFKSFGKSSRIGKIYSLLGPNYIEVGNNTIINDYIDITAWNSDLVQDGTTLNHQKFAPKIKIGNCCNIGAFNHISSINRIEIGDGTLTGKWVTIVDHNHGESLKNLSDIMPERRELYSSGPVLIGKNVWIGEKATILSNVNIGDGAIIGANAVVTQDIPAYSIAVGCPAKVVIRK